MYIFELLLTYFYIIYFYYISFFFVKYTAILKKTCDVTLFLSCIVCFSFQSPCIHIRFCRLKIFWAGRNLSWVATLSTYDLWLNIYTFNRDTTYCAHNMWSLSHIIKFDGSVLRTVILWAFYKCIRLILLLVVYVDVHSLRRFPRFFLYFLSPLRF